MEQQTSVGDFLQRRSERRYEFVGSAVKSPQYLSTDKPYQKAIALDE